VARERGEVEVVGLLTTVTEPYARVSMHGVREELLVVQAAETGLPLYRVPIPAPCPNEVYEDAMRKAMAAAKEQHVTRMIFGDLFLEDVRAYREKMLDGSGIEPLFPLWGRPTRELAEEMIAAGLVAHVTCLDPRKVPRELAGRQFDRDFLARLAPDVDPCAERGEFHTCVSAGPMFRRPIAVEIGETVERDGFVFADVLLASLSGNRQMGGQPRAPHGTTRPELA
jgi:uncharacterized protein (TIGR00290 family)